MLGLEKDNKIPCAWASQSYDLFYGVLFIFFFTLHADQLHFTLGNYAIRANNLIAFSLLSVLLLHLKKEFLFSLDKKFAFAFLFISLSIFLSFLNSPCKTRCFFFLGMWGMTVLCYVLVPYFLMVHFDPWRIIRLYLSSYFFVALYACLQWAGCFLGMHDPFMTQTVSESFFRANAFAYEPSFYALYMTPFIIMAHLHYWIGQKRNFAFLPALSLMHLVFFNFAFLVSTSTSTIFCYGIFFLFMLFFPLKQWFPKIKRNFFKFLFAFTLAFIAFACLFPYVTANYFLKFFYSGFLTHHSFLIRWTGILNALKAFAQFPFLGVGLGGMPHYFYQEYLQDNPAFLFGMETAMIEEAANPLKLFEPTNAATEILGSLGCVGMIAFLSLLWIFFSKARKAFYLANAVEKEWIFLFSFSMLISFIILQFNQGLFRTYIWTHLSLTFGFMDSCVLRRKI